MSYDTSKSIIRKKLLMSRRGNECFLCSQDKFDMNKDDVVIGCSFYFIIWTKFAVFLRGYTIENLVRRYKLSISTRH